MQTRKLKNWKFKDLQSKDSCHLQTICIIFKKPNRINFSFRSLQYEKHKMQNSKFNIQMRWDVILFWLCKRLLNFDRNGFGVKGSTLKAAIVKQKTNKGELIRLLMSVPMWSNLLVVIKVSLWTHLMSDGGGNYLVSCLLLI